MRPTTWNPIESRDFLYAEVSYYDFGTQTTISKQCSRYTGTLYIDGLLNRYGKYRFTFTAYDVNGTPGQPVYIERQCEKAESYYVVVAENLIRSQQTSWLPMPRSRAKAPWNCLWMEIRILFSRVSGMSGPIPN